MLIYMYDAGDEHGGKTDHDRAHTSSSFLFRLLSLIPLEEHDQRPSILFHLAIDPSPRIEGGFFESEQVTSPGIRCHAVRKSFGDVVRRTSVVVVAGVGGTVALALVVAAVVTDEESERLIEKFTPSTGAARNPNGVVFPITEKWP